jgi:hypothetical protein
MRDTDDKIGRNVRVAVFVVLAHFVVLLVHGAAHGHLNIGTTTWQTVFIVSVIFLAPWLAAAMLLWSSKAVVKKAGPMKAGSALLLLSMAGALVFGMYFHFVASGADNALGRSHHGWGGVFGLSAVLVAMSEAIGIVWAWRILSSL